MVWLGTVSYGVVGHGASGDIIMYRTVRLGTAHGMARSSVVQYDILWRGAVWYGMV